MLTFPTHLFNPLRISLRPMGRTVTGGESLAGETDTLRTDGGGHWRIVMAGIELHSPDLVRAWRAWENELDQGVTPVLVPVADVRYAPAPLVARPSELAAGSGDPYFPEAVRFATPWIIASVAPAAFRATEVTILVTRGARLRGGEVFAIDHPTFGRRIYRTGRVLAREGQSATVSIRPPLREALAGGEAADFDWPSVVSTLVPDHDTTAELENGHASVSITFREALWPLNLI